MMVSQGGTGSGISGPSVAELYKTLFGVHGSQVELADGVARRAGTRRPSCRRCGRTAPCVTPESRQPAADRVPAPAPDLKAFRRDDGGGG